MRHPAIQLAVMAGLVAAPIAAGAVTCAAGVYRAGCVGPNGAVVTGRPAPAVHPVQIRCADGDRGGDKAGHHSQLDCGMSHRRPPR